MCNSDEIAKGDYCVKIPKPTAMSPWGKEPFVVRVRTAGRDEGIEIQVVYSKIKDQLSIKTKTFSLDGVGPR